MSDHRQALFRKIPAVDLLLAHPRIDETLATEPRGLVIRAIHETLAVLRVNIQNGEVSDGDHQLEPDNIVQNVISRIAVLAMPSLRNVVNATGWWSIPTWVDPFWRIGFWQNLLLLRAVTAIWNILWIRAVAEADIPMWNTFSRN